MTETLINKGLLTLTYALDQPDGALCSRRYTTLPSCVRRSCTLAPRLVARSASRGGGRAPIALKRGACTSRERACRVRAQLVGRHDEPPRRRPNAVPIANVISIYYSCMTMCDTNNYSIDKYPGMWVLCIERSYSCMTLCYINRNTIQYKFW